MNLAAAATWKRYPYETWCPQCEPRNVTPYCSENDISRFRHVETWEPVKWAPLTPPTKKKTGYPFSRALLTKTPLVVGPLQCRSCAEVGHRLLHVSFGPCFQVVSRSCRGGILFTLPPPYTRETLFAPQESDFRPFRATFSVKEFGPALFEKWSTGTFGSVRYFWFFLSKKT